MKENSTTAHYMNDEEIDLSDIPELTDEFWKNAKVSMPVKKKIISLRVDEDVVEFFKSQGKGYQSRMNAVLKSYMNAQREEM